MATFILEGALSVLTNWSKHLLLTWLCISSFKMAHTRRIMHVDNVFRCKSWTMHNGRLFIRMHGGSCACLIREIHNQANKMFACICID